MTVRFPGLLVAAAGVLWVFSAPLAAQEKNKNSFVVSKGWYDQPDLQGIWEPTAKAVDNLEKGNVIKDPSNHKIPYVTGGAAKREQNFKNAKTADLVNKCYMPGVPRLMYMGYPFQIFE